MLKSYVGVFALLSVTVLAPACSSTTPPSEHLGSTTEDIQGGADDGTAHPFVVGVCAGAQGDICQLTCSGALITPNLVVSARHCVEMTAEQIDCTSSTFGARYSDTPLQDYFITTSATMPGTKTLKQHAVKQIITPTPTSVCGNDISLLILNDLVPASEATPAIPGTGFSLTDHTQYTASDGFTAIGYGITSPSGQDSGTRRIKTSIPIECIPGDSVYDCAAAGAPRNVYSDNEFIGGDGTCQGDSGSSAWAGLQFSKGIFVSMGVLSRGGQSSDGTMCQESIYTRLDVWHDLIVQTATTASDNWTLYPKPTPDWTVYVAPPPMPAPTSSGTTDAGPTKPPAGTKKPGDACSADSQCASMSCVSQDSKTFYCAQSCTVADATSCPANEHCDAASLVCLAGPAPTNAATPETTTTKSGCSVAPIGAADPTKPVPWKHLGLIAAVGLFITRRRRRST